MAPPPPCTYIHVCVCVRVRVRVRVCIRVRVRVHVRVRVRVHVLSLLQVGAELMKACPLWWVRLIIILITSQSDANSSNGKKRGPEGGGIGGPGERGNMEEYKIRFAFLLEMFA